MVDGDVVRLEDLRAQFQEHLYLPETVSVDFVAATVIANRLPSDPVWGMIIGPSGGGKTEVVQSTRDVPEVYELSALTGKTFLSGRKTGEGRPPASLLNRLDESKKRLLVLKDFTTILSMRFEERAEILSALREIYDGSYKRETGMGDVLSWTGRLGFLAGVTPAIDLHHAVIGVLGERFVYLRLPAVDAEKIAGVSLDEDHEKQMRTELRNAMAKFLDQFWEGDIPNLTDDARVELVRLATKTAWLRSSVSRDSGGNRDILMTPSLEAPTRVAKQLRQLWRGATIMGHEDPLAFVRRVARDSTRPTDRLTVAEFVAKSGRASSTEIRKHLGLPHMTGRRLIEDLEALGVVEVVETGGEGRPNVYSVTLAAQHLFSGTGQPHPLSPSRVGGERKREAHVPGGGSGWGWTSLLEQLEKEE